MWDKATNYGTTMNFYCAVKTLLYILALSIIPIIAYYTSFRRLQIASLAGDMLITVVYVLILSPVIDLGYSSHRLLKTSMPMTNL